MILEQLLLTFTYIGSFVTALFVLSLLIKRNDIADVAWGTGIFIVAIISYFYGDRNDLALITTALAGLWGVRLTLRIFLRNRKKSEDFRYKKWREDWGKLFYIRSFLQVYLLQGFLMVVVGYPFVHMTVFGNNSEIVITSLVGLALWLIGFFFETVGDWQLDRFIASKTTPNQVLSSGLWKYTRHPNYFGEVTMWWGLWLMIASTPVSYIALISPVMITFLILKVSGIPMLEKSFSNNPNFQEYKKRTSAFFPLPPKRNI